MTDYPSRKSDMGFASDQRQFAARPRRGANYTPLLRTILSDREGPSIPIMYSLATPGAIIFCPAFDLLTAIHNKHCAMVASSHVEAAIGLTQFEMGIPGDNVFIRPRRQEQVPMSAAAQAVSGIRKRVASAAVCQVTHAIPFGSTRFKGLDDGFFTMASICHPLWEAHAHFLSQSLSNGSFDSFTILLILHPRVNLIFHVSVERFAQICA